MSVASFEDLEYHVGHDVEVAAYGNEDVGTVNVAIQCETCGSILLDFDRDSFAS